MEELEPELSQSIDSYKKSMGGIVGQEGAKCITNRNYKQFRIVMKAKCTQETWERKEVREIG